MKRAIKFLQEYERDRWDNTIFVTLPLDKDGDFLPPPYKEDDGFVKVHYDTCKESCLHRNVFSQYGKMMTFLKFKGKVENEFIDYLNKIEELLNIPKSTDFIVAHSEYFTFVHVNDPFWKFHPLNLDILHIFVKICRNFNAPDNLEELRQMIYNKFASYSTHYSNYLIENIVELQDKIKATHIEWWECHGSYLNGVFNIARWAPTMKWLRDEADQKRNEKSLASA